MFSGIGGFELGIQRAFHNQYAAKKQQDRERRDWHPDESGVLLCSPDKSALCVGYSEIDKHAIATYKTHFGGHKNYGDATKIDTDRLPDFDFLVGGFPCQAFSIAGKRRGFEDTRGALFFEIARILKAKQPRMFLLENVKGLLNHDRGETFTTILKTIDELGYDAEWQILNSKHFGVPQNRERVFIVGYLRGQCSGQIFPLRYDERKDASPVSYALDCNYGKGPARRTRTMIMQHSRDAKGNVVKYNLNNVAGCLKQPSGNQQNYVLDDVYGRRLTPIECERLQGFPDNWTIGSDSQRYKQLGNAVTVNVIEYLISQIQINVGLFGGENGKENRDRL